MSQFVHLEAYSRSGSAGASSAREIAAEAVREPDYCKHVAVPQAPRLILGDYPHHILDEIEARLENCVDPLGRKIPAKASILVGGVATYPKPIVAGGHEEPEYQEWLKNVVKWAKKEFGDQLKGVVEHLDEAFPHVHFYIVPKFKMADLSKVKESTLKKKPHLAEAENFSLGVAHPGITAREAVENRRNGKARSAAYKAAMVDFQDRYYKAVSEPLAHPRMGPGRLRLSRKEWKAHKETLAREAALRQEAQERLEIIEMSAEKAAEKASEAEQKAAAIEQQLAAAQAAAQEAIRKADQYAAETAEKAKLDAIDRAKREKSKAAAEAAKEAQAIVEKAATEAKAKAAKIAEIAKQKAQAQEKAGYAKGMEEFERKNPLAKIGSMTSAWKERYEETKKQLQNLAKKYNKARKLIVSLKAENASLKEEKQRQEKRIESLQKETQKLDWRASNAERREQKLQRENRDLMTRFGDLIKTIRNGGNAQAWVQRLNKERSAQYEAENTKTL